MLTTTEIGDSASVAGPTLIRTPDQRVRVFISSTLGELATERAAARSSVEQLRLTPIMFELGARPHPPRALYRSYLAQSDVFVGIYWQRYGWVAPDMDISGLEDELMLARGLPRLIYVKRPAPDIDPRLADLLHGLEGDSGPSYRPFSETSELHDLLLDDLSLLLAERFERSDPSAPRRPRRSSIPASTSSFVGRDAELEQLRVLLSDGHVRLLTLAGPGGTGKTRLALEVARGQVDRFADGVVFVGLAAERAPDDAFGAIARALEATTVGTSPLDRVRGALEGRHMLLVLDNVEQVTAIGVGLVKLLEWCPRITFVVTSREALRVSAEHVFAVPVLSLPVADGMGVSLDDVQRSEAGRLFIERASAVGAGFAPTEEDAADISFICRRLDGLPLAIELAAARVKLYSVTELRRGLERRLDLLTGGGQDRPDRQRTLRDAIEWSHQLLSDDERRIFRLQSVFSGARLDDIDQTVRKVPEANGIDVVETIGSLLDKNLLRVTSGADRRPRFSMLETIRAYAAEHLAQDPVVLADMRLAHAEHYSAVALEHQRELTVADRPAVLAALGDELGNLTTAWQTYRERRDVTALDGLLAPLWGYYEARGDYRAALALGEDLLAVLSELPDTPERRQHEFALRANLARAQLVVHGFDTEAERSVVDALQHGEASAGATQRFPVLRSLAALQLWRSDFVNGGDSARALMVMAESEGDPALLLEARLMSCISTSWPHDLSTAVTDADAAVAAYAATTTGFVGFRVGPNPGVVANAIAGLLKWTAGSPDTAATSMQRALALAVDLDHPYSLAFALHHATLLDYWRGEYTDVQTRAEESTRVAEAHGYTVWGALALVFHGVGRVAEGDCDRGIVEMEQGFERYEGLSTPPIFWPALLAIRASAHATAGNIDRALVVIEEAWSDLGAHPVAAELALAHGDIVLAAPNADIGEALDHFERAAEQSARRGARMLEIQALTRLAIHHSDAPERSAVLARLGALYDTFTEGFDTPPLRAAAAVLAADSATDPNAAPTYFTEEGSGSST